MSTAMLSQPATVAIPSAIAASAGPASPAKKRRRRAPATGAAEDCFTCRANGIKCDRRRPYCGPCLDVGMGCKGYRTQLTWGVGVASRGKLRGLHLPIQTPIVDPKDAKKIVKKRGDEKSTGGNENGLRSKRSRTSLNGNGRDDSQRNGNNGIGKLSIITSYDFVNMEPPSNSSSAVSRTSSARSANSSAMSARTSPALSGISRTSMPSQRVTQGQKSPQSSSSYTSSYSASSQPQYRIQSQQQQYQQPPVHHYHKSPYSHVSLPPQQPTSSMLLSPMSEYEPKYEPSFPSPQHYPMSSAPSTAPLYEMVTGVSSASYRPSASMTVTTTGVSYAPMVASMHPTSRMMDGDHLHSHHNQNGGPGWNGVGVGIGNLHPQHGPAGTGNLSDLLYDDDMLAIATPEFAFTSYYHAIVSARSPTQAVGRGDYLPVSHPPSTSSPFSIRSLLPPPIADLPANLHFFINCYVKAVCASAVAFDGPGNPCRQQIPQMTFSNKALMDDGSDLRTTQQSPPVREKRDPGYGQKIQSVASTPNRRFPYRRIVRRSRSPTSQSSSNGTYRATSSSPDVFQKPPHPSVISSVKGNSSESPVALEHKAASIKFLNAQLADPHLAKTDSAMATLLILLLYHICKAGVGQSKMHLAGVKKLMDMGVSGRRLKSGGATAR